MTTTTPYTAEQAAELTNRQLENKLSDGQLFVLRDAELAAIINAALSQHAPKELSVEDGAAPVGITEGKERSDTGVAGEIDAYNTGFSKGWDMWDAAAKINQLMAEEYQAWIEFYDAGNGDFRDFISLSLGLKQKPIN